jgi:ATP-dependent helicase/nuclease subunit A
MTKPFLQFPASAPPDQAERSRALDPSRSFLVQAPAGSGKTYLLTQRFLRLLSRAEKPDEIVAITFTNAAAAEMRQRILSELEKAEAARSSTLVADPGSLAAIAAAALARSEQLGWQLLDQPGQLRIMTIDSFCRSLALQCPLGWGLLSGLGGRLDMVEDPSELYRRAARRTLNLLADPTPATPSVEALLSWRDNNWSDVENLLVKMLHARNRWYQDFVFTRDIDEDSWNALRMRLEAPFHRGACRQLDALGNLLDASTGSRESALRLARLACECTGPQSPHSLAELADLPIGPWGETVAEEIEIFHDLACFLLTKDGDWRKSKGLQTAHGFASTPSGRAAKLQFQAFVDSLDQVPGLRAALAAFRIQLPTAYTDDEWTLVRHGFAVLRAAAGQLQVVFAESGMVDFTEVAQIALRVLAETDGTPSDFAIEQAASIRHLLVDEFQDTSRNQHQLLSRMIAAWPEREGRTCFCVGDPMQSIYGFREAEVELFERLKTHGLDTVSPEGTAETFEFEFLPLRANFRTEPSLVRDLNNVFAQIFAEDDGSGVGFSEAEPARPHLAAVKAELHTAFTLSRAPQLLSGQTADAIPGHPEATRQAQLDEIVALIRDRLATPQPGRIAVLGRTRKALIPVAEALETAGIPFRAIELVTLRERPEILDALALARAVVNPTDRTAWLGVLRAPWCGLTLAELHLLTSADDEAVTTLPLPELLETRLAAIAARLSPRAAGAAGRVARILREAAALRAANSGSTLGTWLESIWKALGGEDTADPRARENLRLLWKCLDGLPNGEVDLQGPALNTALDRLFAVPDPAVNSESGVQLMTIHKSKGLEFEVVIVPDLDSGTKGGNSDLFAWIERGLPSTDSGGDLTEFLIAPIAAKGSDAGNARRWVNGVCRLRETQEMRRVLYVAATRARDQLHLFARPRFSVAKDGAPNLAGVTGSLLATAWPAFGSEIQTRFDEFEAEFFNPSGAQPSQLTSVAAAATTLGTLPFPATSSRPNPPIAVLRRLPADYQPPPFPTPGGESPSLHAQPGHALYERTEGGLRSRVEGAAIHMLLDRFTRLRAQLSATEAAESLAAALPAITASIRSHGLSAHDASQMAESGLAVVRRAVAHPIGDWIAQPHPESASESAWTGVVGDRAWNLRPDRVFLAPMPGTTLFELAQSTSSAPAWWIIDYKTSHASPASLTTEGGRLAFLLSHRGRHHDQLEIYGRVLRGLRSIDVPIYAGIYYPRLLLCDVWELSS